MAKRYSKFYSNFILSKKYQYTTKGTIWERDWVTIGAQHQIEKGKRPFYGDSGFLFTDNSIPDTHKRHDFGKIVGEWTYDDVYSATPTVNVVKLNRRSNDLRDFAYYGSCSELVRSSILNIIAQFPACLILSNRNFVSGGKIFENQFGIDLITENINEEEVVNTNRYMSKTWGNYRLIIKGKDEPVVIESYNIDRETIDPCEDIQKAATIKIKGSDGTEYTILAYLCNGDVVYTTANTQILEIRPSTYVIEEYFYNLDGFEEVILRRDTLPLYTNTFLKMFDTDGGIRYAYRTYTWPVINDYCIDIESPIYLSFVEELSETAREFDEMWTDNMWRNMTHEAIKNYDWTYKREYTSDEVEDFVEGGNRVEKIIRIYGRIFDDLKRYIDGIRFTFDISYNGFNNMPDAEISDRLEFNGWEIYSTIPSFDPDEDLSTVYLNDQYFVDNELKWFLSSNNNEVTASTTDVSFLRQLAMSSKYLMKSKGTLKSIDMIMSMFGISPNEYSIEEKYRTIEIGTGNDVCNASEIIEGRRKHIGDLVHYDNPSYFYDDPYEGVPFGDVELYNRNFIIPYYVNGKYHLGEFAFQSDGGWYKKSLDTNNRNDYEETLSYLHVVPNFSALLEVNTYALSVNGGDDNIYYVVDVSDYVEYNENIPYGLNHYFYCTNVYNPELPSAWEPILEFVIDPNGVFLTQEQYDDLPLYVRNHDKDIADDYPPEVQLPESITKGNMDAYESLGYVYVCDGEIVKYISVEDYEAGKFGYNTPSKPCDVKPDGYINSYRYKYQLHNTSISSSIPFMQDINNMMGLEEIGEEIYNILGYAENGKIQFEDGVVNDSSLYDVLAYNYWSPTYKPTHTFDLRQLYEHLRKVNAYDYVSLKTLYEDPSEKYVKVADDLYAPIIGSNPELWARAVYLDSIISTSIGNNPHTGYGHYDLGGEFYEYMQRPFKYYLDNYNLSDELREEMESYNYVLSDNYSAVRWGEITSDIRQPYLVNTGWSETSETVDDVTTYTYKKNNPNTIIDGKVKNIANTYKYMDGYFFSVDTNVRRYDWAIPYIETMDGDEYVYTKEIQDYVYNTLPEAEKNKWTEQTEEIDGYQTVIYVLKPQYRIRSSVKREDLLRGWYEYDITDGTDRKFTYRKDITQEEYDALPSTGSTATEPNYTKTIGGENGWQESVVKFNLFSKYTDVLDDIENSETKHYYINNKLLILRLKSDAKGFFKKYFLDVIGKYVMQVIPSTAITVVLFDGDE